MAGTVVFDLDGTLADTSGDLIAAANACFRARGLGDLLDPVGDALIAFHGGRAMLRAGYARLSPEILLPPGAEDEDYGRLLDHYGQAIAVHTRLYPGAEAALEALAHAGHRLAVCTNKPAALAETLLQELGIRDRFAAMVGADSLPVRKPDPRPYREAVRAAGGQVARSFLVGDTETDRKTAAAAGVRVALVAFGPEGAGLARLAPEAMLRHFDDLPQLARDWLTA
ncbi:MULTISPECIES: HAD-IA family hydrolase [unclassified Paracoccus (in: a-proteobacteria)]|uniref:HAD-IA family hydrolase n=1 Tax=unclassified Paracoccus (in: a-proteobacteria) TaxID=2688777 RepID=UPI0012B300D8|nr:MULTISPECIES: HAD-IA family hydrolase [unclassified Paracoccus (in: a-proteobacteria)]UXU75228.1 HAD-IA family hydrolase [Paracoccus sp. SMMA_5]UXU81130.1 HAD-IA family hydrolase [Paracoccus sp. SMMA_5_TC]